jgi:mannose-6-phosphate isomerase
VYLGFREEISLRALTAAVESSQGADLLDRVNPVAVEPGDAIFVPAGIPHAIGEGVFLTEVQEPSDLIVRLEWTDYVIGSLPSDLGLGFAVALHAVNRSAVDADRLATLIRRHGDAPRLDVAVDLLPQAAAPFFRVERVAPARVVRLDPGFSIIIVVDGSGELRTGTVRTILRRGTTALVPWASGAAILTGNVEIIRCRPPDCAVARSVDPGPIP